MKKSEIDQITFEVPRGAKRTLRGLAKGSNMTLKKLMIVSIMATCESKDEEVQVLQRKIARAASGMELSLPFDSAPASDKFQRELFDRAA